MATTVSRVGCRITVTVRIEFRNNTGRLNAAQFQQLVNGWEQSIEALWNGSTGSQRYRCCTVTFNVVTKIGQGTNGYHQVNVVAGPQTSVAGLGPGSTNGRWDDQDTGAVAAHETGHLLCLPDEYDYNGPGGAYRNLNPQPAGQPQSIMAQTWGNAAALQEHIDAVMECTDATCPWYCCIFRWIDWLVLRRVLRIFRPLFDRLSLPRRLSNRLTSEREGTIADRRDRPSMKHHSIDSLLDEVRSGDPDRLTAAYDELLDRGDDAVPSLREALDDESPLVRWAAAGALGGVGSDEVTQSLQERLDDPNASVRVVAAQSLARLGDSAGVPALIRALEQDDVMIGHPPELTSDYAVQVLRSVSGERFGFDSSAPAYERARAVERWEEWWDEQGEEFTPR
ncbi:HEAT repeat domain-containing protein [Salinigranum sp. GCM10025319]|uniref:HEAT repeat domain-containing protein n=1 Tax=Salinigranum sp. GCM10025319 TaxID=3252687 RepID=UPI0036245492